MQSWAKLLDELPTARFKLKNRSLNDPDTRAAAMTRFNALGLDTKRIDVFDYTKTVDQHLVLYQQIDIALDSYPYNGATTTCEALWMGIPVVSLSGERHASRMGLSILSAVDLQNLVSTSDEQMLQCCLMLAKDLDALGELRLSLRQRMQQSSLLDAKSFTLSMEELLQQMWHSYCSAQDAGERQTKFL